MAEKSPLSDADRLRVRRGIAIEETLLIREPVIESFSDNLAAKADAIEVFGAIIALLRRDAVVLHEVNDGLFGRRKIEDVEAEVLADQRARIESERQQAKETARLEEIRRQIAQEMSFNQPSHSSSSGWRLIPIDPELTFQERPEGKIQIDTKPLDYNQFSQRVYSQVAFIVDNIYLAQTDITCGILIYPLDGQRRIGFLVWDEGWSQKKEKGYFPKQRIFLPSGNQSDDGSGIIGFQNIRSQSQSTYWFKVRGYGQNITKLEFTPLEIVRHS